MTPHHSIIQIKMRQEKHTARTNINLALKWLTNKFPAAFDNQVRIRPLKIGIMHDILEYTEEAKNDGISRSKLREAVVLFTRRLDYLSCLKAKENRIDLFGNTVEAVTAQEAENAANKIKKRIEKSNKHSHSITNNKPHTGVKQTTSRIKTQHTYPNMQPVSPFQQASSPKATPEIIIKRKFSSHVNGGSGIMYKLREKLDLTKEDAPV